MQAHICLLMGLLWKQWNTILKTSLFLCIIFLLLLFLRQIIKEVVLISQYIQFLSFSKSGKCLWLRFTIFQVGRLFVHPLTFYYVFYFMWNNMLLNDHCSMFPIEKEMCNVYSLFSGPLKRIHIIGLWTVVEVHLMISHSFKRYKMDMLCCYALKHVSNNSCYNRKFVWILPYEIDIRYVGVR